MKQQPAPSILTQPSHAQAGGWWRAAAYGEVELGRRYQEADFNKLIEIKDRDRKRVEIFMALIAAR
jgi:hypothetical protein